MKKMNIVFLDAKTLGEINNFRVLEKTGQLEIYDTTPREQIIERSIHAEVIIVNKVLIDRVILDQLPSLKLICVAATGLNNIDLEYASQKGIQVKNVSGYSTDSVAQLNFALLLHLVNRVQYYDSYVKSGQYSSSGMFTHFGGSFWELSGKRLGIIGLGTIGRKVAQIAQSFGMEIVFYSTTGRNNNINYKRFDLDTLLSTSDVVSIHAPLNEATKGLIDYEKIKLMRPCAILLNTGRGGIIVEADLARALNENLIGGAGIDVYEQEPLPPDHPYLLSVPPSKIVLTPHIAWISVEARQRLIDRIAKNIEDYKNLA